MIRAVVDQPGLRISLIGFFLSLFMGLLFKSQITDHKVTALVKNKFNQVTADSQSLKIDFDQAQIALAFWGMPLPHLVVENIKIYSFAPDCDENQLFIDRLEIPLTWDLISNKKYTNIRLFQVDVRMQNLGKCIEKLTTDEKNNLQNKSIPSRVSANEINGYQSVNQSKKPVISFYIDRLKVIDRQSYIVPLFFQSLYFKTIESEKGNNQVHFELRSKLNLFKDNMSQVYKIKSDVVLSGPVDFIEKQSGENTENDIVLNMKGHLIDRSFDVQLIHKLGSQFIKIEHHFDRLSIKSIVSLFKIKDSFKNDLDLLAGLSFTAHGGGIYDMKTAQLDNYSINNVLISEFEPIMTIDSVRFKSLKPLNFEPFKIKYNNFDLQKFKKLSVFKNVSNNFENLGVTEGEINLLNRDQFKAKGQLKNSILIFSNQGERASQKINQVDYEVNYEHPNFKINLNQLEIEQQPVTAQVEYNYNQLSLNSKFKLEIENLILNSDVQSIFNFNSRSSPISLSVFQENDKIQGQFQANLIAIDSIDFEKLNFQFESQKTDQVNFFEDALFEIKSQKVKIHQQKEIKNNSFYFLINNILTPQIVQTDLHFENLKSTYTRNRTKPSDLKIEAVQYSTSRKKQTDIVTIESHFSDINDVILKIQSRNEKKALIENTIRADLEKFKFIVN